MKGLLRLIVTLVLTFFFVKLANSQSIVFEAGSTYISSGHTLITPVDGSIHTIPDKVEDVDMKLLITNDGIGLVRMKAPLEMNTHFLPKDVILRFTSEKGEELRVSTRLAWNDVGGLALTGTAQYELLSFLNNHEGIIRVTGLLPSHRVIRMVFHSQGLKNMMPRTYKNQFQSIAGQ